VNDTGVEISSPDKIFASEAFKKGMFEMQDIASQMIAPMLKVTPQFRVIDACAGEGGKTLHSAFRIPIPINNLSTCCIAAGSTLGNQIANASLLIVDEAPMMHRHVYEALDRTLRDIMRFVDANLVNASSTRIW
jgi:hypothetical protein